MKKTAYIVLVVFGLLLGSILPAQAHGHGHFYGSVWIGPGWGPGWWGPPAYPYYYGYYGAPPAVIQEQQPEYVEQAPQAEEQSYWYFCPETGNYYPYVKKCPKGWLKVVPPPAPPDDGE